MTSPHLSLSLSRDLWNGMLRAALPYTVADGAFTLRGAARATVRQLGVRERVAGLLEDTRTPPVVARLGERARDLWRSRREEVLGRVDTVLRIEGTWRLEVDDLGTEIQYGPQRLTAEAFVKGVAEGRIVVLGANLVLPFHVEQRLGATVSLGRIRYARERHAILANLQDVALHLGDHAAAQLVARLVELIVARQVERMDAVPLLQREQIEGLVGPLGGSLRVLLEVADLFLAVDEDRMTLQVRFGFGKPTEALQLAHGERA